MENLSSIATEPKDSLKEEEAVPLIDPSVVINEDFQGSKLVSEIIRRLKPEEFKKNGIEVKILINSDMKNINNQGFSIGSEILRRLKEVEIRKIALGLRMLAAIFCLISFSVMAAGKDGNSFNHYKEYRYCFSVTVIAFVYSLFQLLVQAYSLITDQHITSLLLTYCEFFMDQVINCQSVKHDQHITSLLLTYCEFFMDQVLAYLLLSASSSAAVLSDRLKSEHWRSSYYIISGKFIAMMYASLSMSFLAFFCFSFSCLVSGNHLYSLQQERSKKTDK